MIADAAFAARARRAGGPSWSVSSASTVTCDVNALVEATPISGPACR